MNEILFLVHSFIAFTIVIIALRLGKEALVTTFCLLAVLSNLLILKQIYLFNWNTTCSDAYGIGCFLALSYLHHYFGQALAKKAVVICFFSLVTVSLFSWIHLLYQPNHFDQAHGIYRSILSVTPRCMLSSILIYYLSQRSCLFFQNLLSKKKQLPRFLQLSLPIALSQIIDTVGFTYLALYNVLDHLIHLIVISFTIKILCLLTMTPFINLSQRIVKRPSGL